MSRRLRLQFSLVTWVIFVYSRTLIMWKRGNFISSQSQRSGCEHRSVTTCCSCFLFMNVWSVWRKLMKEMMAKMFDIVFYSLHSWSVSSHITCFFFFCQLEFENLDSWITIADLEKEYPFCWSNIHQNIMTHQYLRTNIHQLVQLTYNS